MKTRSIRGFKDILPDTIKRWHHIENVAKETFERYGYGEIRIPEIEFTNLFARSIGTTTDIVKKEMYTFTDLDGSSITLRPEGTAGVVRAFIEHSMHLKSPVTKLYYTGTMFRHERPQKGRYRGFNQIGAEYFGSAVPYADVEIISMLWNFLKKIGLSQKLQLEISSLGDESSRPAYMELLVEYFTSHADALCPDCRRRLETNPLRILDCKKEACTQIVNGAPSILDSLRAESREHFDTVKNGLTLLSIPFVLNPRIVRGLDYYTRTVFEITTDQLGAQNSVAAGGRYDGLVENLGGVSTPAIGFALGMERLILLHEIQFPGGFSKEIDAFVAHIGDQPRQKAFMIAHILRENGMRVEIDYEAKSLKSQLKRANKLGVKLTLIIGEDELKKGTVIIRDMELSEEKEMDIERVKDLAFEFSS